METMKSKYELELESSTSRIFELELELETLSELQNNYDLLKESRDSLKKELQISEEQNLTNTALISTYKTEVLALQSNMNTLKAALDNSREEYTRNLNVSAERIISQEEQLNNLNSILLSKDEEMINLKAHYESVQDDLEKVFNVWFICAVYFMMLY